MGYDIVSIKNKAHKGELKCQTKIESKTSEQSANVGSVLNVSAVANVTEIKVEENKVRYGGKITFCICYENNEGIIKKTECGSEFAGVLEGEVDKADIVKATARVAKADYDLTGAYLTAWAYLDIKLTVLSQEENTAICKGEDIIVDVEEASITKGLGERKLSYPLEEEFELSYLVKEVLYQRAEGIVTAVQCGVGSVIVDGEIYLSELLLQNNEKSDIIKEIKSIPFRTEVEYEEAMPSMQAFSNVKVKSLKTNVTVDEEKGVSTVNVSIVTEFEAEAFLTETVQIAKDAFCLTDEINAIKQTATCSCPPEVRVFTDKVSARVVTDEIDGDTKIICTGSEKVESLEQEKLSTGIKVTGVASAKIYYKNGDGKVFAKVVEAPFASVIDCVTDCAVCEITPVIKRSSARLITLSETEVELEISYGVICKNQSSIDIITSIEKLQEKTVCDSAISVYIAMGGEGLFSLAKRLNVCPDDLVATNKDLQFPLTGKERIVIYRQK